MIMPSSIKTSVLALALSVMALAFASPVFAIPSPSDPGPTGDTGDCVSSMDGYCLLAPLPLDSKSGPAGEITTKAAPADYIKGVINLAVAAAGVVAVLKLIFAGFTYITSDGFGRKSNAREQINNAIVGLILTIGAFTILKAINPTLLVLNLNIPNVGTGKDLGNQEFCPGEYINGKCENQSDGEEGTPLTPTDINSKCTNCVKASSQYKKKDPAPQGSTKGGCLYPGPCMVEEKLDAKLSDVAINMSKSGVDWQVTEMYPPTVHHKDACHSVGTCVDASLLSGHSARNVVSFMLAIQHAGLTSYQWEELSDTDRNSMRTAIESYVKTFPEELGLKANDPNIGSVILNLQKHVVSNPPAASGQGTLVGGAHMHINSPIKP